MSSLLISYTSPHSYPIHLNILFSSSVLSVVDDYPSMRLYVALSPLIARLTDLHIRWLLSVVKQLGEILAFSSGVFFRQSLQSAPPIRPLPPRLSVLSSYIVSQVDLSCDAVHIAIVGEEPNLSILERELVFQEALNDFLSHFSCLEKNFNSIECAKTLCIGRLTVLGVHEDAAKHCVQQAQEAFLEALKMIRHVEQIEFMAEQEFLENPFLATGNLASEELGDLPVTIDKTVSKQYECIFDGNEAGNDNNNVDDLLQTIETSISNAVERVISSLLPSIYFYELSPNRELLVIEVDHLHFYSMGLYYDRTSIVEALSLTIRNGNGIYFAKAACETACCGNSIKIVFVEKDRDHDFGSGGIPAQALHVVAQKAYERHREVRLSLFLQSIDFVIHPNDVDSALETLLSICLKPQEPHKLKSDFRSINIYLEAAEVKSLSLMFTANDLSPFLRLWILQISATCLPVDRKCYRNQLTISIQSIELCDVTADAWHSEIISFECRDSTQECCGNIVVDILFPNDRSNNPSLIYVRVDNTRIVFLQRWVGELTMYFLDAESHCRQLVLKYFALFQGPSIASREDPSLSPSICISIWNSSIIFPRDSVSADLLALQFGEMKVMKCMTPKLETFAKDCLLRDTRLTPTDHNLMNRYSSTSLSNKVESGNDEFFDCLQEEEMLFLPEIDANRSDSSEQSFIVSNEIESSRIVAQVLNIKIFTATGKSLGDSYNISGLSTVKIGSFIDNGSLAFCSKDFSGLNGSVLSNRQGVESILRRRWTLVTQLPFALDIDVDLTPYLKLSLHLSSMELIMASSQLYLLFSVWYGNLQELPKGEYFMKFSAIPPMYSCAVDNKLLTCALLFLLWSISSPFQPFQFLYPDS